MKKYGVFIIFVLKFLSGISSECLSNGKPSPQWFMQFGARGGRNVAVIPNGETDQKYNNVEYLSGISSECLSNGKPSPQWFMQFGARGGRNVAVIPNGETDQKYNNVEYLSEESAKENINRDMVKKSGLPLVLIGHQYYYIGKYFKTNFYKAMQFCEEHGMQLFSIETKSENDYILDYLKENLKQIDHIWTSGTDLGEEGQFVWMSTGKALNYTFWSTPQPDNAGNVEHCMEIWKLAANNYVWNDIPCSNSYNFICELRECSSFCLT